MCFSAVAGTEPLHCNYGLFTKKINNLYALGHLIITIQPVWKQFFII